MEQVGGRRERLAQGPLRKEDVTYSLFASMGQATEKKEQRKRESVPTKKLRDLAPLVLVVPTEDEKLTLEIRGRQQNDCGLRQQPCQTEDEGKYHRERPESLGRMAGSSSGFTTPCCRLSDSYLSGTQQGSRFLLWERRQRS